MTAALVATAVVAVLAIIALAWTRDRAAKRRGADRGQIEGLASRLRAVEQQLVETQQRAWEAETGRDEAEERADAAEHRLASTAGGVVAAAPLWELERLRTERTWAELAGPSVPLPVPWDGTVWAAVAIELEMIREEIGTPSRLEPASRTRPDHAATAVVATRITAELLRRLAKVGEELTVAVEGDGGVAIALATDPDAAPPDLSRLITLAEAFGGRLVVSPAGDGTEARFHFGATCHVA